MKLGAVVGAMSISFIGMLLWVFFQRSFAGEERLRADKEVEYAPQRIFCNDRKQSGGVAWSIFIIIPVTEVTSDVSAILTTRYLDFAHF